MAKRLDHRTFNVSVIGLSGTEKEKGALGVGKSCLCNRFMYPVADKYHTNHISVLSQTDFSGRVVNNDHFLYWGDVTKTSDDGVDFKFHIIEQTEFVDDSSFQPFKSGRTETYIKRATATKISSAEKLMYICKDQLGLEHEFIQKLLPEGKFTVDGFLCLFDVSNVAHRSIERMVDYTVHLLNQVMKTKKPVLLVTSKNDDANDAYVREAEKIINRKEFKGNIFMVESSAHENINVELAFLTLAHLIDRTKGRTKIVPYSEATRTQKELREVATAAYINLLRSQVTDYKTNISSRRFNHFSDYNHYVDIFGTDSAKRLFKRHVRQLKDEFINKKQQGYLDSFRGILHDVLPDLQTIADRSWPACLKLVERRDDFDTYFVRSVEGFSWFETELLESQDPRIPFDLLNSNEAEDIFRHHVKALRDEQRRTELRKQFKQLLGENSQVTPGKQLSEVDIFFLGRECYSSLSEEDRQGVFEEHQREITEHAKQEFMELLLENPALFMKADAQCTEILHDINTTLKDNRRYRALNKLEDDRKVMILKHLAFHQCPSKEHCPFKENCVEVFIHRLLSSKAHRPQSWNRHSQWILDTEDNQLNLVLLGSDGLANDLVSEIRSLCVDDDYQQDGTVYSLDYRPIDGDVGLPHNSFKTADFLPHGCFCVYSSLESLGYIRQSLTKTLLSDLEQDTPLPFQGLPIVLILAYDSSHTGKALEELQNEGQELADSLQCPFIGLPATFALENEHKFLCSQVNQALQALIKCIKHRADFVSPWQIAESIEPDIRILMCLMCGDNFPVDVPLGPLLHHQCCYVTSDKFPTLTLETYLGDSKRKVEVCAVSYHGGYDLREGLFHGYILIYYAKRRASLEALRAMASVIPPNIPTKILAVTESGGASAFFSSDFSQTLISEGNMIADDIGASFMITSSNFQNQSASFTPFFKETWDKKRDTEVAFSFSGDEPVDTEEAQYTHVRADRMAGRPPARLPKLPKHHAVTKGSTSNSTEDSEPVYDHPHAHHSHSDSDHERASSATPPYGNSSPRNTMHLQEDVYSEISPGDEKRSREQAGHPKSRRSMYIAQYRGRYARLQGSCKDKDDDSESASRSPSLLHEESSPLSDSEKQPHYQFRKSNSMRLALKEDVEGHGDWTEYEHPGASPVASKTLSKAQSQSKPKSNIFSDVTEAIWRNKNTSVNNSKSNAKVNLVKAPLATPEAIEIGDYAQVRDAVEIVENDYASVQDALPAGKLHRIRSNLCKQKKEPKGGTDSDSEFSSLERDKRPDDIYSRVNRKPTPHKKKHRSSRQRGPNSSLPPLPVSGYEDREHLIQSDQLEKVMSNSPSEGSEGTGDELQRITKQKKRRSFKVKKKKQQDEEELLATSPPEESYMSADMTKSMDGEDLNFDGSRESSGAGRYGDDMDDLGDGNHWRRFRPKRSEKDPEKMRKKEEKRLKDDERRRAKEEEKKQKEQEKSQRKMKKKDSKMSGSQAGNTLEEIAQIEDLMIPPFVEKCIVFIEQEGLTVEGIYRVPGNKAHVDLLLDKFREDREADWHQLDIPVNAVATALKGFFNDLTEPLIPKSLFEELLEAAGIPDKSGRMLAIRGVIKKLPPANHEVLKYLMVHLYRLTRFYDVLRMDSKNLAICWWPTILRPDFTSIEKMTLASKQLEEIITLLIEENGFFFYGDPYSEV